MRNFKKFLLSFSAVIATISIASACILTPFLNSEFYGTQDHKMLDSMSGKIDLITVGASNTLSSVIPNIVDSELNCFSYRICGRLMTLKSRYFLLKRELQRNPVKAVIIDVSDETLTRDEDHEYALGHEDAIWKLSTFTDRVKYLVECATFEDLLDLYSRELIQSIEYWLSRFKGVSLNNVDYNAKGYSGAPANDLTLSSEQASEQLNKRVLDTDYRSDNLSNLESLIELCKTHGVRVIVTVTPVADSMIWSTKNSDSFYFWMSQYCKEKNIEFYDFNLIKSRYELFNDRDSYRDEVHMSDSGAKTFSKTLCSIIKKAETEDVSQYFYSSYEEMKADSPYMKYLN